MRVHLINETPPTTTTMTTTRQRPASPESALAKVPAAATSSIQMEGWTREDIELLKDTIAKGASDPELRLFGKVCERTGLDPFARQIYLIKRWDTVLKREVASPQTSIDGFRLVADRTGLMDGHEVYWCGADGEWRDVWLDQEPPAAAKVIVFKKGCSRAFPAIALFREYAQTTREGKLTMMWAKMPANQLAKCAESLAIRKAFPAELSGLYTREEMGQAEVVDVTPAETDRDALQAAAVRKMKDCGVTAAGMNAMLAELGGEGCRAIGQLPDDVLITLAKSKVTPEALERWNGAAKPTRTATVRRIDPALPADVDPTPEPEPEVIEDDEPMLWAGGDE
jgi:phage recombination protein Bet